MKLNTLLLTAPLAVFAAPGAAHADLVAIRVGLAETATEEGPIEHAVVLVEDGKIVTIGQDLPIGRGIPVIDRPDWVVMPGLVSAYSRLGLDSEAGDEFTPQQTAESELLPRREVYDDVLEHGVTTLALYPAGSGVAGQALVVRPQGDTKDEMILKFDAYLKMRFNSNSKSRKTLEDAFEKVDEYAEKLEKEREKYDKAVEKAKKKKKRSSSKKKDDDDDKKNGDEDEDAEEEEIGPFVPPELAPEVEVFQRVRAGALRVLFSIGRSADYLHLVKAVGDEEFDWSLRIRSTSQLDVFWVKEKIGADERFVLIEPNLTLHPGTSRQRNMPRELDEAGAKVVLLPSRDSASGYERWRRQVGGLVATGLDRQAAIRAMTSNAAEFLGIADRLGSLAEGRDANMIFLNGDPFEPGTQVEAVMLEGEFVHGEVQQ